MKLGLISDVHGDLRALERALFLFKSRHAVDAIWCAGDLVGRGHYPNEVVERVVGEHVPAVMGNHDEFILLLHRQKDNPALGYKPTVLRMLLSLPRTYRAKIEGRTLVMVHGTPRSNAEGLHLVAPNQRREALSWLRKIGADILISGHTHVPMQVGDVRGLVVNPGSLFDPMGFDRASSETYGVLDTAAMQFSHYPLWG